MRYAVQKNYLKMTAHTSLFGGKSSHTRQVLALEKLQRGAATGGDVSEVLGSAKLLGDSSRIATANNDGRTVLASKSTGSSHGSRALGEGLELEDTRGSVPNDGLRGSDGLGELLGGAGTAVKTHPAVTDATLVGGRASVGIGSELVGSDEVDRKDNLDVVLLGVGHDIGDDLGTLSIEERVADGHVLVSLLEGEGHATTDDETVNLGDQVVDKLNLVADLGAAKDSKERTLGVLKSLAEVAKLLAHEETSSSLRGLDTNHGRVGTVSSAEGVVDVDVTEFGERSTESRDGLGIGLDLLAVGLLSGALLLDVVTEVLEQNDRASSRVGAGLLDLGADAVVEESDVGVEQLLELLGNGLQRVLLNTLAVGTAEVRHQDDALGALLESVLNCGQSSGDALVVGDLAAVEGDVEVDTDKDALALKAKVGDLDLRRK